MPGLKSGLNNTTIEVRSLGAARPAVTKRRSWVHPELVSHSLVVLTLERLYLAPMVGDPKPETLAAVDAGGDLDAILGPLATTIDLVAVRRIKLDLMTNSLIIEYLGRGHETSRATITFTTPEAAAACFTKMWPRTGARL